MMAYDSRGIVRQIQIDGAKSQYRKGKTIGMKTNKKTILNRLLLPLVLMLTLTVLFSSCGGGTVKTTLTLPSSISAADGGAMTGDQLRVVGEMLITVYDDASFDVRDWLIAATRGYDMTAEGFDDKQASPTENGNGDPVAIGLAVLRKANAQAKDSNKISEENFAHMNAIDLQRLVDNFKTTVVTEQDGGFFDRILQAVGVALNWITNYLGFGFYILGICIFSVIVEILMLPFAVKQQKNSIRQAQLRPKEMAIRNKYKGRNDQVTQQKVQKEIQELYQRENFSPFRGCLQLLLQFPILIALYRIVIDPLHYALGQGTGVTGALTSYYTAARAAGGMGQVLSQGSSGNSISILAGNGLEAFEGLQSFAYFNNGAQVWESLSGIEKIPNFNIFGINFGMAPDLGRLDILLLVPVITFVVYYFSMKLSRKFNPMPGQGDAASDRQTACSNSMMDITMPLMSTFFAFMVPGLIGVYWIFRSILGTLKQFIMSRVMPLPVFTEADYKAAAKEMAGKAPKVVKSENAGKVRSLHHIDDEDFDDTRERALARKALMEEQAREEQAKKAKDSPFSAPELKSDRASEQADGSNDGNNEK